jgi:hypothetical protein
MRRPWRHPKRATTAADAIAAVSVSTPYRHVGLQPLDGPAYRQADAPHQESTSKPTRNHGLWGA